MSSSIVFLPRCSVILDGRFAEFVSQTQLSLVLSARPLVAVLRCSLSASNVNGFLRSSFCIHDDFCIFVSCVLPTF